MRAWEGQASHRHAGGVCGVNAEETLMEASEIAASLGDAVRVCVLDRENPVVHVCCALAACCYCSGVSTMQLCLTNDIHHTNE